jgi:hypothetical protein
MAPHDRPFDGHQRAEAEAKPGSTETEDNHVGSDETETAGVGELGSVGSALETQ